MDKPSNCQLRDEEQSNTNSCAVSSHADESLDPELDELLNDTLHEFERYSDPQSSKEETCKDEPSKAPTNGDTKEEELAKALMSCLEGDPAALLEFEKLSQLASGGAAGAAGAANSSDENMQKDLANTFSEALKNLSQNTESTLNDDVGEEELLKQLQESLNLGDASSQENPDGGFIPMMQNMMSSLLSKEVLYPSLKDLAEKYPDWISTNNGKIPKTQFDAYVKQFDLVSKLCEEYESESTTDSQQVKDERFERILDLMTQMQDCGPPPKEIVTELAPGLSFDGAGNPQLPGMEQCSVM